MRALTPPVSTLAEKASPESGLGIRSLGARRTCEHGGAV